MPCQNRRILQDQSLDLPSDQGVFISIAKHNSVISYSLSDKNMANDGRSSYECGSLAEPLEASAAGNFFWRVLARRRATLREFSALFVSFDTFQK